MAGLFVGLAIGLLSGEENFAGRLLERAGLNAIMSIVGGRSSPLGAIISGLLRYGGAIDKQQQKDWLDEVLGQATRRKRGRGRRSQRAHQQWLQDNSWRFDWRSQPRVPAGSDAGGEWIEGRLDHPVATKPLVSRSQRRVRTRAMKAYKKRRRDAGETRTRAIVSSWGTY